ncbi:uncharacterized protein si:ch211-191i18.2 [Thunnus thynnus]|uniref:uncharacterized protein si:ch211-191i18.2 n=1 Tax=Thunnus thynnus TaxID=8237 RepID=UPI00352791E5
MSSLSFLYFYLIGVSLILLLTAVSEAQYYEDYTTAPDYDYENATFEYSFFSNSTDDLEKLLKGDEEFTSTENPKDVEGEEVTVTTATTRGATERVNVHSAASLPVHLDFRTLVWTLMILISLNVQQLQHTL